MKTTPSKTTQDNNATRGQPRDPQTKINPTVARIAAATPSGPPRKRKKKKPQSGKKPMRQPSGAAARNIIASAARKRASDGARATIRRAKLELAARAFMYILLPRRGCRAALALATMVAPLARLAHG